MVSQIGGDAVAPAGLWPLHLPSCKRIVPNLCYSNATSIVPVKYVYQRVCQHVTKTEQELWLKFSYSNTGLGLRTSKDVGSRRFLSLWCDNPALAMLLQAFCIILFRVRKLACMADLKRIDALTQAKSSSLPPTSPTSTFTWPIRSFIYR